MYKDTKLQSYQGDNGTMGQWDNGFVFFGKEVKFVTNILI
jgi:hypothetical protein